MGGTPCSVGPPALGSQGTGPRRANANKTGTKDLSGPKSGSFLTNNHAIKYITKLP